MSVYRKQRNSIPHSVFKQDNRNEKEVGNTELMSLMKFVILRMLGIVAKAPILPTRV